MPQWPKRGTAAVGTSAWRSFLGLGFELYGAYFWGGAWGGVLYPRKCRPRGPTLMWRTPLRSQRLAGLGMTVPTDQDKVAVVVLADLLQHDDVPVDPCGDSEGEGAPMDPHGARRRGPARRRQLRLYGPIWQRPRQPLVNIRLFRHVPYVLILF